MLPMRRVFRRPLTAQSLREEDEEFGQPTHSRRGQTTLAAKYPIELVLSTVSNGALDPVSSSQPRTLNSSLTSSVGKMISLPFASLFFWPAIFCP